MPRVCPTGSWKLRRKTKSPPPGQSLNIIEKVEGLSWVDTSFAPIQRLNVIEKVEGLPLVDTSFAPN